jgi:hypothetical protein
MAKSANIVDEMFAMLLAGKTREDMLAKNGEYWQLPSRTFDRHLEKATKKHRQAQEKTNTALNEALTAERIKALEIGLKSDLEIELQLLKIGFAEIEVEETTYSEQFGVTTFKRKPTPGEMKAALAEVLKKRGSYAPTKTENKTEVIGQVAVLKVQPITGEQAQRNKESDVTE